MAKVIVEIFDKPDGGVAVQFQSDGDGTPACNVAARVLEMLGVAAGQKYRPVLLEE